MFAMSGVVSVTLFINSHKFTAFFNFFFPNKRRGLASFTHAVVNYAIIRMENEMPASEPLSNLNLTLVPSFSYYRRNCAIYSQGVSFTRQC